MTLMLGADPTITWVDNVGVAHAEDYYLSGYVQVCEMSVCVCVCACVCDVCVCVVYMCVCVVCMCVCVMCVWYWCGCWYAGVCVVCMCM